MKTLHIANCNFEAELETGEWVMNHPLFMQLQFLPFLYAKEGDGVVVTHRPSPEYLEDKAARLHLFDEEITGYDRLETWGWSETIGRWTNLPYDIPKSLRECASKVFAFENSPKLPGAALLRSIGEVEQWLKGGFFPKVIKTPFGMAGRGRWIINGATGFERVRGSVAKRFAMGETLIGEPWVKREGDFSSQWDIGEKIEYLGATTLVNTERGGYQKTLLGEEIPFLDEHLERVQPTLQALVDVEYRGNVGVDAMVYEKTLHPVVEVNVRKTMGWLALKLQRSLSYESAKVGLLPTHLEKITFPKQLMLL